MTEYKTSYYAVKVDGYKFSVLTDGCPFATLNTVSAVNRLNVSGEVEKDFDTAEPVLSSHTKNGAVETFIWTSKSNLWDEKTYTLTCTPLRFSYSVKVKGTGKVDGIEYFSGAIGTERHPSGYEFQDGFFPCKSLYNKEDYYFKASVGCHRLSVLMVPPMFCYAFRCEGLKKQLGIGLVAKAGEHNFHTFDYHCEGGIWFETDQHGHTEVSGEWEAPFIIGYFGEDEFDICRKYSDYYFTSGIAKSSKTEQVPKFWNGPMACGWIEQFARDDLGDSAVNRSRESLYREYLDKMHSAGLFPRILIIDDKWQSAYATDVADPKKWSDMRSFVDEQHKNGIATMLWFKVFDPEGLDGKGVVFADMGGAEIDPPSNKIDPSDPEFLKVLDDALYRIFSSDEGCYDCDGIKIDYAFMNPVGRKFKTYSGKYGVELLYDYMEHIYTVAKKIKPTAIINCSACHPYFSHMVDHARVHDYDPGNRYCHEDIEFRAKMYRIATPHSLIDTDNGGYTTKRDFMRSMLLQSGIGIPDIYCISRFGEIDLNETDFSELAAAWREYTDRIDSIYNN